MLSALGVVKFERLAALLDAEGVAIMREELWGYDANEQVVFWGALETNMEEFEKGALPGEKGMERLARILRVAEFRSGSSEGALLPIETQFELFEIFESAEPIEDASTPAAKRDFPTYLAGTRLAAAGAKFAYPTVGGGGFLTPSCGQAHGTLGVAAYRAVHCLREAEDICGLRAELGVAKTLQHALAAYVACAFSNEPTCPQAMHGMLDSGVESLACCTGKSFDCNSQSLTISGRTHCNTSCAPGSITASVTRQLEGGVYVMQPSYGAMNYFSGAPDCGWGFAVNVYLEGAAGVAGGIVHDKAEACGYATQKTRADAFSNVMNRSFSIAVPEGGASAVFYTCDSECSDNSGSMTIELRRQPDGAP